MAAEIDHGPQRFRRINLSLLRDAKRNTGAVSEREPEMTGKTPQPRCNSCVFFGKRLNPDKPSKIIIQSTCIESAQVDQLCVHLDHVDRADRSVAEKLIEFAAWLVKNHG